MKWAATNHKLVVSMEENVASGGYGEKVRDVMGNLKLSAGFIQIAIPDEYVEHGNVELLKQEIGIDAVSIVEKVSAKYKSMTEQ